MGEPAAVAIRDAASVLLVRDGVGPGGTNRPEVWMLTRVIGMVFAAGMTAFVGGQVDADDHLLPWAEPAIDAASGRSASTLAAALGCDVEMARALVGAAVRETFEETGVLLSVPSAQLAHAQADVEAGRITFARLLADNGLAIDADAVHPWARWVTPLGPPRRYDTRFFIATLPAGAVAEDLTTESSVAGWISVADALDGLVEGRRRMLPPTVSILRSIAQHATVAEVIAAAPSQSLEAVRAIESRVTPEGRWMTLPDGYVLHIPTDPNSWRATS